MKNDELLQAAQLIAGWEPFPWREIGVASIDKQVLNKLIFIARAHVAEHRADDDEPVTEEWLVSAGSQAIKDIGPHCWPIGLFCYVAIYIDGSLRLGVDRYRITLANTIATRGDVRRLCKSINISTFK